ncbi:hypothetical protein B1218_37415, partial [Pseudomonas ogarae]
MKRADASGAKSGGWSVTEVTMSIKAGGGATVVQVVADWLVGWAGGQHEEVAPADGRGVPRRRLQDCQVAKGIPAEVAGGGSVCRSVGDNVQT